VLLPTLSFFANGTILMGLQPKAAGRRMQARFTEHYTESTESTLTL